MLKPRVEPPADLNPQETTEWLEALDQIIDEAGPDRAAFLLDKLLDRARGFGAAPPPLVTTPYVNTIPPELEVEYPGDRELERRIKSIIRWNAMAMVVRANKYDQGIGGHISTFASLATVSEVGFNHFFRSAYGDQTGDLVYYQGHASPGVYARAYLEGRLSEKHLENFRHELREHPGLSSYPHPWLMPDLWSFPTVSMGIGPISAIYQARFMRYLENRGLIPKTGRKVYAFLGDGEMDEPESTGALKIATYEKLDNLVFVVNCNLQRLDGPVRGNGKIIQELEGVFHGSGWNVIKVVWSGVWDDLLARDTSGLLIKRMEECVDGDYQTYHAKGGAYFRQEFFGKYPELLDLVSHLSDQDLEELKRGGHDPTKVYNAFRMATEKENKRPSVILVKTVKGYGLGEAGEGKNISHQQKKMNEQELAHFRSRFEIPIPDHLVHTVSFYKPPEDSPEMTYLRERRATLGGSFPVRKPIQVNLNVPELEFFRETLDGSQGREVSTTMAYVRLLTMLLRHPEIGKYIVPIVPDEARTFGMESLFRQVGIYACEGQKYKPVDSDMLLYYKEAQNGQILQEGITEAGATASFTAAGTAYSNYGVPMIPLYIYYSMFGFQRIGDQLWAFADSRGRGFLLGATAGRTTLSGEGLQHQDGHSHVLASTIPTCAAYDPSFAYELAVIIQDGLRRMYQLNEDRFYYITVGNENYAQPPMPEGAVEGILKGIYRYRASGSGKAVVHLFGSGSILNEALRAQQILSDRYNVAADVWSVTSYNELRRDALDVDRWNRLHPDQAPRTPYIVQALAGTDGPIVAASDYMKIVSDQIAPWLPDRLVSLGTDGFGRSENREYLRQFFEVNAESIVVAALSRLSRQGKFEPHQVVQAMQDLKVDAEARNPAHS